MIWFAIGLILLNTLQIKVFNHLKMIQFQMPQVVLDAVFDATPYAPTKATGNGACITVDGVRHLDIGDAPETIRAIESLLNDR